ncbi:MAG: hypothetical protein ACYS8Z_07105 [Planctomycetota bacterium]|jgi:hypothetical protein
MSKRNVNIIVVLAAVVLSTAIFANSMSKPVGRDEQMYCTAAVLMSRGKMIYRDFSYAAQLPYHPLLLATIYRISGTSHYLLAGRIVSTVSDILVMICILGIYRRIFRESAVPGALLGLAGAVLYVFNPLVDYANGYAWNHDLVILCVAAAFWLYITLDVNEKLQWLRIAAIGGLLTFAACMRITTLLVALLFLAMLFARPANSIKTRCKRVLPFLGGVAVMLIWPVWVIAQAPEAFFLNLFKIPVLYGRWLREMGMVFDKTALTVACLTTGGYLSLIAIVAYSGLTTAFLYSKLRVINANQWLLAGLLVGASFVIAFIPPTMWRQYFAPPAPFLVIALAYPLFYLSRYTEQSHFKRVCIAMGICVSLAVGTNLKILQRIPLALVSEEWTPVIKHRISQQIGHKVAEPKKVLTLAPLFALEGGCEVYDELSAGSIIYRIGDFLSPEDRALTRTVGSEGLRAMIDASPPSAVLLGVEAPHMLFLEEPLKAIVPPDWKKDVLPDASILYFEP